MTNTFRKNASSEIFEFKEAVRHVWNLYFSDGASSESLINFEKIEIALFRELVVRRLGLKIDAEDFRRRPLSELSVSVKDFYKDFPISVGSQQSNGNMVWSSAEIIQVHSDQCLFFVEFFEWNHYGFVDYPFVRCYVEKLPQMPEHEGKFGLIEHRFVDFFIQN